VHSQEFLALTGRVTSQDPTKLESARKGGLNKVRWYGSKQMAAQGRTGGIVRFLRYGSEGMRAMISAYWEDVRAGRKPAPGGRKLRERK